MSDSSALTALLPDGRRVRFARFAWAAIAYVMLVIAWGAFVRATGSGAGCGDHWPLCNGELVPQAAHKGTWIEFSHRVTSGLSLLVVGALYMLSRRTFGPGHLARKAAAASVFFVVCEALIGGVIVLYKWVAYDTSLARGYSTMLHLGNTFFLLASLVATAHAVTFDLHARLSWRQTRPASRVLALLPLLVLFTVGVTGAIAALGDTLFPSNSLAEGFQQDLSPTAHVFLRLRVLHPVLALSGGVLLMACSAMLRYVRFGDRAIVRWSRLTTVAFLLQFSAGVANLMLRAPVPMQLVHLLLADFVWIVAARLAFETFSSRSFVGIVSAGRPIADVRDGKDPDRVIRPASG